MHMPSINSISFIEHLCCWGAGKETRRDCLKLYLVFYPQTMHIEPPDLGMKVAWASHSPEAGSKADSQLPFWGRGWIGGMSQMFSPPFALCGVVGAGVA